MNDQDSLDPDLLAGPAGFTITNATAGQALCDAFGLDANAVREIVIEPAGGGTIVVTAKLTQFHRDIPAVIELLRHFTITPIEPEP